MNKKNEISIKMINDILIVDRSNLDGNLLCARMLDRVDWVDNLGKGKYHVINFDKVYKLIAGINKHNAKTDALFARDRLLSDSTLF